ncbi:hypothetical protein Tsubulata_045327 [Turnera subulata]|uniref:RING-type domain-containing protein n=1 Tax=Turnera subulata TaxID=218843 RepID=A0A9Q0F5T2_9ROSI|nr:hypothetical protein Tsubulata_045327 [Turnera subulata]
MSDHKNDDLTSKIAVLLIGVGSAALVVTIYHCLAMTWCNPRYRARAGAMRSIREPQPFAAETPSSVENSMAQLIPAYKYQKSGGLAGDVDDDRTCAICLCEFEEGEELRALPECMHSYHAACIDMWLYSHTNCPMCRTDATPLPQFMLITSNTTPPESDSDQRSVVYQNVGLVHSRTM